MDVFHLLTKLVPRKLRDRYRDKFYQKLNSLIWHLRKLKGLPKYPIQSSGGYNLHLGCGQLDIPNFINVDMRPFPHVHHRSAVEFLPFIESESIALLYVSHCLEHIQYQRLESVLQEWNRVLKIGGTIYIAVPDFDSLLEVYESSSRNIKSIQGVLMGGQDYPQNYHYTTFNKKFLTELLEQSGFINIEQWAPLDLPFGSIIDCSSTSIKLGERFISISLNLVAVKKCNLKHSCIR